MTSYKPEGYTSVSPYLVVNGAAETIRFLETVFDAMELRHYQRPDGTVMHAEIGLDDSVIMLADPPEGTEPHAAHVHIYVADVDATYAKAIAAGATSVQAPEQHDDEDKRGGIRDSGGTTWWISTQLAG